MREFKAHITFGGLGFGNELIGFVGINSKACHGARSMALRDTRRAATAAGKRQ